MGRLPNAPSQKADGYWYSRHPGLKRTVRLAATTFAEAMAEQQSFYGVAHAPASPTPTVSSNPIPTGGNNGGSSVLNLDDDEPTPPGGGRKADSAIDLLSTWAKSDTPVAPPATTQVQTPPINTNQMAPGPIPAFKPVKIQKGLTPEQSAKIASGLKKMVTNTNIVVIGAAVQMFGRVPAQLDDEEISLLQMGWDMWLDELFLKAKLKPVHLVIVGNIAVAISMWATGKQAAPKIDPKSIKAAPGHQATVTPIVPVVPPKG